MADPKTKERVGIALAVFPNWNGERIDRGIGIEGTIIVDVEDAQKRPIDFETVVDEVTSYVSENTIVEVNAKKRSIKVKQPLRFDVALPLPTTDEDAQALYGVSLASLVEAGVMKISYDRDTNIGNEITSAIKSGIDFAEIEDVDKYAATFQEEISTPKEKTVSQAKENKKKASELDALMAKYGVTSAAELASLIQASKEQ